jgi:hypothetical protein
VNTWRVLSPCWQKLPLSISARIVGEAMKNCTVSEDTWEQIERGKYGFDDCAKVDEEVLADLFKRIIDLSMVSKSVALPVSHALEALLVHFEEHKATQRHEVGCAEGGLWDAEYDTTGSKQAALDITEGWLDDLTSLGNHAYKMYCVVSCWGTNNGTRKIPRKLKRQIERQCLRLPKLRNLRTLLTGRRVDRALGKVPGPNKILNNCYTRTAFEPCREGFQKLSLLARCYPTAWLVQALRRHSARLLLRSNSIEELLSSDFCDQDIVDLKWAEQTMALRDEVEALLGKVYTWAVESW